jgi:hypothetical protein
MVDPVSISISVLSLVVASVTAWLALLRRGSVKMTQPTVIYFGPDSHHVTDDKASPKIYLRTLLFATAKRGRVIESLHVALSRNETRQTFNIWVYGESGNLVRGSGLFVGETGVATAHHFLTPSDGDSFKFSEGHYQLDVFARLLGDQTSTKLFSQSVDVTRDIAAALEQRYAGVYFDWGPDSSRYLPHVETHSPSRDGAAFLKAFGPAKDSSKIVAVA